MCQGNLAAFLTITLIVLAVLGCGEGPERYKGMDDLSFIAEAVRHYRDNNEQFPPVAVADADGQVLHSWRVLILPYLESNGFYAEYDFQSKWNSAANAELVNGTRLGRDSKFHKPAGVGDVYQNENGRDTFETAYVFCARQMLVERPISEVADSVNHVAYFSPQGEPFLIVELEGSGIHWMEPRDLNISKQNFGNWISIDQYESKILRSIEIGESIKVRDRDETLKYLQAEQ